MTQMQLVVEHLREHGEITSAEAISEYGITRVGAYICLLRKAGYDISTVIEKGVTRYGAPCNFARYVLKS